MAKFSEEVLKFLNIGIESELMAYVFYKKVLGLVDDDELNEIVRKLAADEKHHFLQLEEEYDKHVRSEMWAPYKDIMRKDGLPDMDEHITDTHRELLEKAEKVTTKKELFELALILEKEAFEFFDGCYNRVNDDEAKKIFDYLRNFEKGHILIVENELKNL